MLYKHVQDVNWPWFCLPDIVHDHLFHMYLTIPSEVSFGRMCWNNLEVQGVHYCKNCIRSLPTPISGDQITECGYTYSARSVKLRSRYAVTSAVKFSLIILILLQSQYAVES
jgi:hypothetical protein